MGHRGSRLSPEFSLHCIALYCIAYCLSQWPSWFYKHTYVNVFPCVYWKSLSQWYKQQVTLQEHDRAVLRALKNIKVVYLPNVSSFYRASICDGGLGSRNSVCLSVCHTRGLWQIEMVHCRYFDTTRKGNQSATLTPTVVGGRRCQLSSPVSVINIWWSAAMLIPPSRSVFSS